MKTFAEFQEAAFAIPAAAGVVSKVLPAAVATYGAYKTIKDTLPTFMQIKKRVPKDKSKIADIAREMGLDLTDPKQRMKASSLVRRNQMKNKQNNPDGTKNIRKEEVAIANNASSGAIAGLPPDDPPVKKNKRGSGMKNRKKKKYAYGGKGSRKMWMA